MILVTGGCGYIGSHVVRQLSESGREIVVFDNLSTGFRDALVHGEELVVGDLSDTEALESLFEGRAFETVIHFAAAIIAPESVGNPLKYYSNNTRVILSSPAPRPSMEYRRGEWRRRIAPPFPSTLTALPN